MSPAKRRVGPAVNKRIAAACLGLLSVVALAAPAGAQAGFETGIYEGNLITEDDVSRPQAFAETARSGASIVRLDVHWRRIAFRQVTNPTDPADPGYYFRPIDEAVKGAVARGLKPMITIYDAPASAEGPGRPPGTDPGTWMPDANAFGAFTEAIATRYSGKYQGLPRVRYWEAWNEPNLPLYLNPQYDGQRQLSGDIYRRLLDAFYGAVKGVNKSNLVIAGATAPYGDEPSSSFGRTRPLVFDRAWMCVSKKLKRTKCGKKPKFDILSHHPIDQRGGPTTSAVDHDDVATPDLGRVVKLLRGAERANAVGGKHKHAIWASEIWWESNPPDSSVTTSLKKQARWLAQSFYLIWKAGAKAVIYLSLYDQKLDPTNPFLAQSGLLFDNGGQKPSFDAFRFPFVTDRKSKRELLAWGLSPSKGKAKIQVLKQGKWRTQKKVKVRRGKVFTARLPIRGKAKLRAKVGSTKSPVWRQ